MTLLAERDLTGLRASYDAGPERTKVDWTSWGESDAPAKRSTSARIKDAGRRDDIKPTSGIHVEEVDELANVGLERVSRRDVARARSKAIDSAAIPILRAHYVQGIVD